MKQLSIGGHDYKEFIEKNYYYVDKTLLVKELFTFGGKVTLLPRPRRFGKTLNLSMLRYFFEKSSQDTSYLFVNTAIWQEKEYHAYQGQYPVVFITFKNIKELNWSDSYEKCSDLIAQEFGRHRYLLNASLPTDIAEKYQSILEKKASQATLEGSLLFLTELLYNHYQKNVVVLIDEYDTPISASYHNNYYEKLISFMRSLLGAVLKDNYFLERGVVTGIMRIAKESIFSGLNNLSIGSVTDNFFQDKFGFTPLEVQTMLTQYNMTDKEQDIKNWYNGYTFGTQIIYNPWSILNCIQRDGELDLYWANTSDNALVRKLIARGGISVKKELEKILSSQSTPQEIDEGVVFPGIEHNDRAIWSILLYTGYLTNIKKEKVNKIMMYDLAIPNEEIGLLYTRLIRDIWESTLSTDKIRTLLEAFTEGDTETFADILQEFIFKSMSLFDFSPEDPEQSYHLFILGLLVNLSSTHEVKSNRESGKGRSDILIIPHNSNQLGLVLEFKKVSTPKGQTLESAAQAALDQIKDKQYAQELLNRGIKKIQLIGIAFDKKEILVKAENM